LAENGRDLTIYSHLMDAALKAKAASLMPHFGSVDEKTVIVDVGSGTGQLAGYIAGELHTEVYAVDFSQDMLDLAAKNLGKIKLVCDDATNLVKIPNNSVDVMYHGTVGHEIQSFRGNEGLEEALKASLRSLRSGGREIWRDFVKPPEGEVFLEILTNDGVDNIEQATVDGFLNYSLLSTRKLFDCFYEQFKGGRAFEYKTVNHQGRELIKLPAKYAQEFILRKDYTANWRQEIKEEYTYWTPDEAKTAFKKAGFSEVEVINDDNEYIRNNRLNGKVALYKENEQGQLETTEFMTHMVIVGHKVDEETVQKNKKIDTVDFEKLLETVSLEDGLIRIGDKTIKIGEYIGKGQHKKVYLFDDGNNDKVVKIVRKDKTTFYSAFSSLQQSIERQQVLEDMGVKYMRIYDYDKKGPPYRYLIQEKIPEGSICAADLITNGEISEIDIKQMAEVINGFENGKEWQLDTNPYNWFRVNKNGKTEMTYTGGTVYKYNEAWSFDKVGLLQWTNADYINKGVHQSAKLPNQNEVINFAKNWQQLETKLARWWKTYLNSNLQPKTK
jgi:ubiquinone/menaquinone biosynthesis C-methylase UbiE